MVIYISSLWYVHVNSAICELSILIFTVIKIIKNTQKGRNGKFVFHLI